MKPIAFADIETTGYPPGINAILEIAIIRLDTDNSVKQFTTILDPGVQIPPGLTRIHGINDNDTFTAPTLRNLADKIHEFLDGAIFTASNVKFDYFHLKAAFKDLRMPFNYQYLDTVKISRHFYPTDRHHGVDAIIKRLDLKIANRHRALSDTQVLFQFHNHLISEFGYDKVWSVINSLFKSSH